jgi:hypothetical protein
MAKLVRRPGARFTETGKEKERYVSVIRLSLKSFNGPVEFRDVQIQTFPHRKVQPFESGSHVVRVIFGVA